MLNWLIIVSSVFVIILLFYTVKYIVTLLQLNSSEFTKKTQIIIKFKERVCEETQVEYAEPNHMLKAFYTPKDLFSPISMALKKYKLLMLRMLRPVMEI